MSTVEELLEPIRDWLVPVPALQAGICPVCRTATKDGFDECYVCASTRAISVLPITMSIHEGLIHHHLRSYKDAPGAGVRHEFTIRWLRCFACS